jgi:hypothetical protein
MRQLTAGLAIMAVAVAGCAVTGCAATSSARGGSTPAATTSPSATPTSVGSGTATGGAGLGGLTSGGSAGLAQWVVDGVFETAGGSARPLSGVVTFRDSATGHSANVTVGASGKFSLGLVAGTYTATGQTGHSDSPCSAPVTVTVRAGQLTRVSLACKAP